MTHWCVHININHGQKNYSEANLSVGSASEQLTRPIPSLTFALGAMWHVGPLSLMPDGSEDPFATRGRSFLGGLPRFTNSPLGVGFLTKFARM